MNFFKILLLLTIVLTLSGGSALAGYKLCEHTCPLLIVTPNIPSTPNDDKPIILSKFEVDSPYFSDTIMLVSKDEPHITLIASIDRIQQTGLKTQTTRVSFFDGNKWTREVKNQAVKDFGISSNSIIKSWENKVDESWVLQETLKGTVHVANTDTSFETQTLENEIGMRSMPGYTKFMSNTAGKMTLNGTTHDAYVLFTRIYSLNSKDVAFYDKPMDITTHWVAFWDNNGNFYHIDTTTVGKPSDNYKSHNIGISESADRTVRKTFDVKVTDNAKNPPSEYIIGIPTSDNPQLNLTTISSIDKSPKGTYWFMSLVKGEVIDQNGTKIPGVGLAEFVKDY